VPPPGGPPPQCFGSEAHRDQWQLGFGYGLFDTTVRFDDDRDVDMEMSTISLSAAWLLNDTWTIRGSLGAILDGTLESPGQTSHEVQPGGLVGLGVEYRALIGHDKVPYVDLSFFVGASWSEVETAASSDATNYFASDARLGARAGWDVNGSFFPYAAARVFGGPVNWELDGEDVVGSDIHHYQLAIGAAAPLGPMSLYAEWAGLGEQGFSAGLSTSW
jgi:hypothetical protein